MSLLPTQALTLFLTKGLALLQTEFYLIRSFPAHFWKFHPLPPESAQAFSTSEICTPEATPGGFFTFWDKVLSQAEQGFQGQVTSEPGRRGDVARS